MPMNPYQGLKPSLDNFSPFAAQVTMPMNPYQGLKLLSLIRPRSQLKRHNANESLSGIETTARSWIDLPSCGHNANESLSGIETACGVEGSRPGEACPRVTMPMNPYQGLKLYCSRYARCDLQSQCQ